MSERTEIQYIIIHETDLQSWLRDIGIFALFAALIGVGVAAESSAMQWAGFFIATIAIFVRASHSRPKRMSRSEAIAHLQTMEPSA